MADYVIRFVAHLDPNAGSPSLSPSPFWPKYTTAAPNMMTFLDGLDPLVITRDTYRREQIAYMINLTLTHPI